METYTDYVCWSASFKAYHNGAAARSFLLVLGAAFGASEMRTAAHRRRCVARLRWNAATIKTGKISIPGWNQCKARLVMFCVKFAWVLFPFHTEVNTTWKDTDNAGLTIFFIILCSAYCLCLPRCSFIWHCPVNADHFQMHFFCVVNLCDSDLSEFFFVQIISLWSLLYVAYNPVHVLLEYVVQYIALLEQTL